MSDNASFFVHHSTTLSWNGTIVDISIYKKHYDIIKIFTGLKLFNYSIFDQNSVKIFGKIKILKAKAGVELMAYRSINTLIHCDSTQGTSIYFLEKKKIIK